MARGAAAILAAALIGVGGCGGSDDAPSTPAACLGGTPAYLEALEAAPDDVRLEGATPISDCLVPDQDAGPLAQVGESMVGAATELNREVRRDLDPEATVQLGYLVGAVQQAASTSGGIHEDLVLRLDAAARFAGEDGGFPASFERAFGAGYAAGQERG